MVTHLRRLQRLEARAREVTPEQVAAALDRYRPAMFGFVLALGDGEEPPVQDEVAQEEDERVLRQWCRQNRRPPDEVLRQLANEALDSLTADQRDRFEEGWERLQEMAGGAL